MNGALLLMALMVLVSLWATFDMAYSLPKISGMVLGLGVFFAVAREEERSRGWWLSLLATFFAGGLVASDLWHPGFPFHGHGGERLPQGGTDALSTVHGLAGCGHRPRSQ